VAQDGVFPEMHLCILWTPQLHNIAHTLATYRLSQKWRTNYLLPYRGCLNVHEKNIEKNFQTKKLIFIIIIIIINGNTM
jgi:hypothetical protein